MIWAASKSFYKTIAEADPADLAIRATLAVFLFSRLLLGPAWQFVVPPMVLAGLGLVVPGLYKNNYLWYALAACMVGKTISQWFIQDNHMFVLAYWCIAIAISVSVKNTKEVLAQNARIMVGLIFLLAVIWKAFLSPDFRDGSYLYYTFLTDIRFSVEASILAGIKLEDIQQNLDSIARMTKGEISEVKLLTNLALVRATRFLTWAMMLIEGLIALTFLCPRHFKLNRCRNAALLFFSWITYFIVPIYAFGWLIAAMCFAQTTKNERIDRFLLMLSMPLMFIYAFAPVTTWLRYLSG